MIKERKYEKYITLILSIISIILSILLLTKVIVLKTAEKEEIDNITLFIIIGFLSIGGSLLTVITIIDLVKDKKIRTHSIYNEVRTNFQNNNILNKLAEIKLDIDKISVIQEDEYTITISYQYQIGYFRCMITMEEIDYYFEYEDNYLYNLTEEEIDKLPLIDEGMNISALNTSLNEVYNKFIAFIKTNEHKLNK